MSGFQQQQQKITKAAKSQEENRKQSLKAQNTEPDSDIIQILEHSDWEFKVTIIIVLSTLRAKVET